MLKEINKIRNNINEIDFPIGYYLEDDLYKGLIIYYYKNSISLRDIALKGDFHDLTKYYYYDDNPYRNLILLYLEILSLIEKMLDEKMYYLDIHSGNFMLFNNQVKIIDFEPNQIVFGSDIDSYYYRRIIACIKVLINYTNNSFGFNNCIIENSFNLTSLKEEVKRLEKRLENGIRKS